MVRKRNRSKRARESRVDARERVLGDLAGQRLEVAKREQLVAQLVRGARRLDATWAEIALALGVTPQAAHKRYRSS